MLHRLTRFSPRGSLDETGRASRPKSVNLTREGATIVTSPSVSPKFSGTVSRKSPLLSLFKKKDDPRQHYRGSYDPELGDMKPLDVENKLRVAKGAFNFETTTNRPLEEITEEVERTLGSMGMVWKRGKRGHSYKVKFVKKNVKLEIEICKVRFSSRPVDTVSTTRSAQTRM